VLFRSNFTGDLEKKVMSAVEAEFADRRRIQNQKEADAYDAAQDAVAGASSYGGALAAISKSGLPPRLKDALARQAKSKFGVGGGGAGRASVDPDVWVNAKLEAMEFQAKSFGMSTQERADAAKRFNAKYAGKISGSGLRTLNDLFFKNPGSSSGAGKDKYNRFNPNTYINKMLKDAGISGDAEEDMEFWDEYDSRRRQKEAELKRELTNEEQLEMGRKLTSQIVVQKKNNAAERFVMGALNAIPGVNVSFGKDVTVEAPGYKIPEEALWDEDLGAWYYSAPDGKLMKYAP
jgi:hypothetical protein